MAGVARDTHDCGCCVSRVVVSKFVSARVLRRLVMASTMAVPTKSRCANEVEDVVEQDDSAEGLVKGIRLEEYSPDECDAHQGNRIGRCGIVGGVNFLAEYRWTSENCGCGQWWAFASP